MYTLLGFFLLLPPMAAPIFPRHAKQPSLPTRQFIDDMKAKDIDDVLTMYTPDATFTDPDGHTYKGSEELRKLYVQVFATYDSDLTFDTTKFTMKGDAYKAGTSVTEWDNYREVLRTRQSNMVQNLCGECISTWIWQDDGRWIISDQKWTKAACPATPGM